MHKDSTRAHSRFVAAPALRGCVIAIAGGFRYNSIVSPFTEKRFLPKHTASRDEKKRLAALIRERLQREITIVFAYIHGSFITEELFRDIDVGIFTDGKKDLSYETDLPYELSRACGYEIEVRVINDAPVAFQMSVLQGNLLLSKNEDKRIDFIEDAGRRYREYAHFRNVFMEAVSAQQR